MALFVVSYDLIDGKDYKPITIKLRLLGALDLLETLWLVRYDRPINHFMSVLSDLVDHEVNLIVFELSRKPAWNPANKELGGAITSWWES